MEDDTYFLLLKNVSVVEVKIVPQIRRKFQDLREATEYFRMYGEGEQFKRVTPFRSIKNHSTTCALLPYNF